MCLTLGAIEIKIFFLSPNCFTPVQIVAKNVNKPAIKIMIGKVQVLSGSFESNPMVITTILAMEDNMAGPLKYFLISLGVFGFVYFLIEEFLVYTENIFVFIPDLGLFVGMGIGIYVGITYLVDFRTRNLVKGILAEIKNRK